MDLEVLKRRAEMLDTVCKGFHPATVISQLAEKYHVSEACLWSDWKRRRKWIPIILGLEKYSGFAEVINSKLNAVQKAAWSLFLRSDNNNARVGALKVVLESLEVHSNAVLSKEIVTRLEHVEEIAEKKVTEDKKH